jgi:hypothetical protein
VRARRAGAAGSVAPDRARRHDRPRRDGDRRLRAHDRRRGPARGRPFPARRRRLPGLVRLGAGRGRCGGAYDDAERRAPPPGREPLRRRPGRPDPRPVRAPVERGDARRRRVGRRDETACGGVRERASWCRAAPSKPGLTLSVSNGRAAGVSGSPAGGPPRVPPSCDRRSAVLQYSKELLNT